MSETWFDRLAAGRHSRRTTLKAAAGGAAAMMLPLSWPRMAKATETEPCYPYCTNSAYAIARSNKADACGPLLAAARRKGPRSKAARTAAACCARAVAEYYRLREKCRQPSCGDPVTYPDGNPGGAGAGTGSCPEGTVGCALPGDCCCKDAKCCPCSAAGGCICCVHEVLCSDCCPGG